MTRGHVVKRVILTVSPPRQGVGVEIVNGHYDEEPRGQKRFPHYGISLSILNCQTQDHLVYKTFYT